MTKIVYVDRNPLVVEEGTKLLATNETSTIICADIRKPDGVLKHADLSHFIDFVETVRICFLMDIELTHIMLLT